VRTLRLATAGPAQTDRRQGIYSFTLSPPLAPGADHHLAFDIAHHPRGFRNSGEETFVAGNGSFVKQRFLPHLGYERRGELSQDDDRRKYGLPARERMADLDDPVGRNANYLTGTPTGSASNSRPAPAPISWPWRPGQLERRWSEDGRPCFCTAAPARC
jgi:hypothetical protein